MNTIQNVNTSKTTENKPNQLNFRLGNAMTDYFASVNNNPQQNLLQTMQNSNGLRNSTTSNSLQQDQQQSSMSQYNPWVIEEPKDVSKPVLSTPLSNNESSTIMEDAAKVGSMSESLGPMIIASSATSGLIHAQNQARDVSAQRSPNFDAQHIAGLQDSRDETVGEIGMLGTAALGSTLGPAGVALGAIGTGIAESLDTVSSDQTISTEGTMTTAASGT